MNVKQVIVIRTHYPDGKGGTFKARTGKLIAQGAHASMKVFFQRGTTGYTWRSGDSGTDFETEADEKNPGDPALLVPLTPAMAEWVNGTFTKVVVRATSEEELMALLNKATLAGLPCALVEDHGLTEFHGVKTRTAIAIGPAGREHRQDHG